LLILIRKFDAEKGLDTFVRWNGSPDQRGRIVVAAGSCKLVIVAMLALCLPSWKRSRFGSVSPEYQDMCGLPSVYHKLPSPFWPTFLPERFFGKVVGRQGARPIERGHAVTSHERPIGQQRPDLDAAMPRLHARSAYQLIWTGRPSS
jgi:hypothetical protein